MLVPLHAVEVTQCSAVLLASDAASHDGDVWMAVGFCLTTVRHTIETVRACVKMHLCVLFFTCT
jgi:hypothetical protein